CTRLTYSQTSRIERHRHAQSFRVLLTLACSSTVSYDQRDCMLQPRNSPPHCPTLFSLLIVAQYDPVVAAWANKDRYRRPGPSLATALPQGDAAPSYPCAHAAVATASAAVLGFLYRDEAEHLESRVAEHQESRLSCGASFPSD